MLALLVVQGHPAHADEAKSSLPTEKWVVDFAENQCMALRSYSTPYGKTILHIRPDMLGGSTELIATYGKGAATDRDWGDLTLSWPGRVKPAKPEYYQLYELRSSERMLLVTVDWDTLPQSDHQTLSFKFGRSPEMAFNLGKWTAVQRVLARCMADLRKVKGIDEGSLKRIAVKSEGEVVRAFSTDDYPSAAVSERRQGIVNVLFWVNERGRAENCTVLESSGSDDIDRQTCSVIIYRSRFKPARDHAGKPIREPKTARIRWELPSD